MSEELRILLYPLGILPLFFFSARFLVQWLFSEWNHRCVVPKSFWYLSLAGHILMFMHSGIQLQFHVGITQACSGVISWRNLNLMGPQERRISTRKTIVLMLFVIVAVVAYFIDQDEWFRAPQLPGGLMVANLGWGWHIFGTLGLFLFSARFFVQWWQAETEQESRLSAAFWWISIVGNSMTLIYFFFLKDPINFVGPLFAMIPYVRNLVLLRKTV